MSEQARRGTASYAFVPGLLTIALALGAAGPAPAGDSEWIVRIEPVLMNVLGHDQHVMTVHEIDADTATETKSAISIDGGDGSAFRGEVQNHRGRWGWGLDVLWFTTTQSAPQRNAAAEGAMGTIDEVIFEVADRSYSSTDPAEVLYYSLLEDTDLSSWTVDAYGLRTLGSQDDAAIRLQFGVRVADFDNDYRAIVGIQGDSGTWLRSSSNYGRLQGPLVGLYGELRPGKQTIRGYLGQSVLLGDAELFNMTDDFTGTFAAPTFTGRETFRKDEDVAIPVTELRLDWTYRVSRNVALGLGTNVSAWWDLPVPPGVIPGPGGNEVLHENTVVFFGIGGKVVLTF